MSNFYKDSEGHDWITWTILAILSGMVLAVIVCVSRMEQRKTPNQLRGEQMAEKYRGLRS